MKTHTVIAPTTKGHRVYLQDTAAIGWVVGAPYGVTYEDSCIVLQLDHNGKRKVSSSKGGVIDLESKKVTRWAQGSTQATVVHDRARGRIIIQRVTI